MKEEKIRLRERLRHSLAGLVAAERLLASQKLVARLVELEIWQSAAQIGLFASRADEIDTSLLFHIPGAAGKVFHFPKMIGDEIEFLEAADPATLQMNRWGIAEPVEGRISVPDLVLVPGLGFDTQGGRLGRGRGYYDRWLAAHPRVATLGVCFQRQIVERIPREPHDRKMDAVVTDEKIYISNKPEKNLSTDFTD